jgi:hypothetical protein
LDRLTMAAPSRGVTAVERVYRCETCGASWTIAGPGDLGSRVGRHDVFCARCRRTRVAGLTYRRVAARRVAAPA